MILFTEFYKDNKNVQNKNSKHQIKILYNK